MINIQGIDKAELLLALTERAVPQGRGIVTAMKVKPTLEICQEEIKYRLDRGDTSLTFDWFLGRPIKVTIGTDELIRADLYDRDNGGPGTAEAIVATLKRASNGR